MRNARTPCACQPCIICMQRWCSKRFQRWHTTGLFQSSSYICTPLTFASTCLPSAAPPLISTLRNVRVPPSRQPVCALAVRPRGSATQFVRADDNTCACAAPWAPVCRIRCLSALLAGHYPVLSLRYDRPMRCYNYGRLQHIRMQQRWRRCGREAHHVTPKLLSFLTAILHFSYLDHTP